VFLLQPGDKVRFESLDPARFAELDRAAASGAVIAEPDP
jgi:hypothetical protein